MSDERFSHIDHPPLLSDDDGRPHTPETAQFASQDPPKTPGKDPNSTPAKASATSTAHAFDRPTKKSLRPVYTGLEGMEYNLKQVPIDELLKKYIPGPDLPKKHLKSLHYIHDASSLKPEWRVNTHICRLAQSVIALKDKPSGKSKKGKKSRKSKKAVESPIVVRDIGNWSVRDENSKKRSNAEEPSTHVDDEGVGSDPAEDPKTDTRVDVGVFFENDRFNKVVYKSPDEFMKKSKMKEEDKKERKDFVGHCSWADILVPIEVKIDINNSAFYFDDDPAKFLRTDNDHGRQGLGQIGEYVGQVFGHQHRVHLYAVYVFKDRARLLYFERQGALVSEPFIFGTRKHLHLHTFFYRLAHMSREELGLDPTVVPAKAEDVEAMLAYAPNAPTDYIEQQIYRALSINPRAKDLRPEKTQWPPYELTMCGKRYVIARPTFASPSLYGRCTRGYLAYDIEDQAVKFLKDQWRLDLDRIRPEHEVYERLQSKEVSFIATCAAHEDVPSSNGSPQCTTIHSLFLPPRPARRHYRLLINEVGRPLTDFKDFAELTALFCYAIIAHQQAWENAGVMHRDVSVGNILIVEKGRGECQRVAILSDWDLCKYKEEMSVDKKSRTPDRTGTWYFRSALSLLFPLRPYRLADDIESFVHVYYYCVLRFHPTNHTYNLAAYVEAVYDAVVVREADGAHIGSMLKLEQMQKETPSIIPTENETLAAFLTDVAELCYQHYKTIDLKQLRREYDPQKPSDLEKQKSNALPAQATDLTQYLPGEKVKLPRRQQVPRPVYKPELNDHNSLLALFLCYATGRPDEHGNVVRWPAGSTKCEDLFKGTSVAPRKNNNFSSSFQSNDQREELAGGDGRPVKRRKGNTGSALPNVEETVEEGAAA